MAREHIGRVISGGTLAVCATLLLSINGYAENFGGKMKKFTISGSTGEPEVALKGFPGAVISSDPAGNYTVDVPYNWSGTVTPQKAGFSFEPASRPYDAVKADMTGQDYTAKAQMLVISGSAGMGGVILEGFPEPVTANEQGLYKAYVPYNWTGSVTPMKDGYEFTPKSKPYTVAVTRNLDSESYKAAPITFEVAGLVKVGGTPLAGVVLQGLPGNPQTNASGAYSVKVSYRWNGNVTPTRDGYVFDPAVRPYTKVDSPAKDQDYSGSAIQYTISGTVGLENVALKGFPGNVVSGADGQYTATVAHGWTGEVTPTLDGYIFDPAKRPYAKTTENKSGDDYTHKEVFVTIAGSTGQPGVVLDGLPGPDGQSMISDGKGSYTVKVRFGWSGAVAPKKEGFVFKPEGRTYNRVTRDLLAESFSPNRMKCVISGTIDGLEGVVLKGFPTRVVTAQTGAYNTTVDFGWSGDVTPEKGGFEFTPPGVSYKEIKESQLNQDYVPKEKRYKISGKITCDRGSAEGIMVMPPIGDVVKPVAADPDGRYELDVPYNWAGVINFLKEGYVVTPIAQQVPPVTKDLTYNFTAKVKMLTITGEIFIDGQPVPGVTVTADNGGTSEVTSATGKYKVQVPYGWTGAVTPTKEGIDFDPPNKPYENVIADLDETLGAKAPTTLPAQQPSVPGPGTTSPSKATASSATPESVPTTGPSGRKPAGAKAATPAGQGSGAEPQAQQPAGFSPEAELRMAKIEQLQKELEALKTGRAASGTPAPGAGRELTEVKPGAQRGMVPDGSQGPLVSNMNIIDTDIRKALQDIAVETSETIVLDPEVGGNNVSCNIQNMPLEQALDTVLAGSGFTWKKTKYYYLVTSAKLESPGFVQGSVTKRHKMTYLDAETSVRLLSSSVTKYVQAQAGQRTVVITAPPSVAERIDADLTQLDKRPRQVMLESKIVSLEKGDLLNLGVEWGWPTVSAGLFGSNMKGVSSGTTGSSITDFGTKFPWGVQIGYSADGTFTNALTMALNLLAENNQAKIVSKSQVFAQDGKKADISVLTDEYYMMTAPVAASSTYTLSSMAQFQTVTSGTKLSITPYIGDSNDIVLEVAVEMSNSVPTAAVSKLPVVTRRITNNTVTVRDGGTVAIAGLTENQKKSVEYKVPGLSDLPLVGKALFTNNDDQKASREIAVFVTARLVPEMSAFNPSSVEPAAERESASQPLMMEPSGAEDFKSQLQDSLARRGGSR